MISGTAEQSNIVTPILRRKSENKGIVPTEMELVLEYTQQGSSHEVSDTLPILLSFTHCGNKTILRVLRIILVILPEHPSETKVFHNEDGNPARANIKQALGSYERSHKGVKASANSDIVYFFTSAQDGNTLQDDERLDLADDLMKAQVHNQRQDLNLRNVLRTVNQCEGLYYYNNQGEIPLKMWTECILTATYLINRLPSSVINGKSPYEMIYKKFPTLSHLRVFGCLYFATIVNNNDKFGSRSEEFTEKNDTTKVFQDINHINFFDIEYPEMPNDDKRVDPNLNSENKLQSDSSHSSVSGRDVNTIDFPDNSRIDADSSEDIFSTQNEKPKSFLEASKYSHWTDAMNQKMDALLRNGTWEIMDLPKDRKAIGSKWIFKIKFKSSGEIDRYKARLIAQGFG
ncbi:ribonuclease H-like domain-containing protein [Tanacetum coccineum]